MVVVDAHELIATSLVVALRQAGFDRVAALDPDNLDRVEEDGAVEFTPGDIVLVGLLYGDGRTTLPLIHPLVQRECRVLVMASDQALPLTGECLAQAPRQSSTRGCRSSVWSPCSAA